jgi:hypothetical protein
MSCSHVPRFISETAEQISTKFNAIDLHTHLRGFYFGSDRSNNIYELFTRS